MICTMCKVDKVANDLGKKKVRCGQIVWQDDKGRCWNYKVCPDCRYGAQKKKRPPPRIETRGRKKLMEVLGTRTCTFCKGLLPIDRRYFHAECYSKIDYLDWNELYVVNLG